MSRRKTNRRRSNKRSNRRKTRRNSRRNARRYRRRGGAEERPTFRFKVTLKGERQNNNMNVNNNNNNNDEIYLDGGDYAQQVIDWYVENQGDTVAFFGMQDVQLQYDPQERVFICRYLPTNEFNAEISLQMYVDLDDDGNHPIEIDGREYLVIGHLEEENN